MSKPSKKRHRIKVGAIAGQHIYGKADLSVSRHIKCGARRGYLVTRKRLRDRAAFNYDPSLGWEVDRWIEWIDDPTP